MIESCKRRSAVGAYQAQGGRLLFVLLTCVRARPLWIAPVVGVSAIEIEGCHFEKLVSSGPGQF